MRPIPSFYPTSPSFPWSLPIMFQLDSDSYHKLQHSRPINYIYIISLTKYGSFWLFAKLYNHCPIVKADANFSFIFLIIYRFAFVLKCMGSVSGNKLSYHRPARQPKDCSNNCIVKTRHSDDLTTSPIRKVPHLIKRSLRN